MATILDESEELLLSIFEGECAQVGDLPGFGCTDETACNYNSEATLDDGSCCFIGTEFTENGSISKRRYIYSR